MNLVTIRKAIIALDQPECWLRHLAWENKITIYKIRKMEFINMDQYSQLPSRDKSMGLAATVYDSMPFELLPLRRAASLAYKKVKEKEKQTKEL